MPYNPKPLEPVPGLEIKALMDVRLVEKIRVLEKAVLPVTYSENHYEKSVLSGLPRYNQLAFYQDMLVGTLTARLELVEEPETYRLYIMTICVLEPYRHMGIGSRMLEAILKNVANETTVHITGVYLNVQTSSRAIQFYKKFDFEQVDFVKDYYVGLDCNDAYTLSLAIPQPLLEKKKGNKKK